VSRLITVEADHAQPPVGGGIESGTAHGAQADNRQFVAWHLAPHYPGGVQIESPRQSRNRRTVERKLPAPPLP
jgi:hypothetical protein